MLKDPKRKRNAQLLVSVCSYLYHIADIPYYRQEESYLYWMYEMHKDWIEQDDETEDTQSYKREFRVAEYIGDSIEQRLFNRTNIKVFEQRLNRFKINDTFDKDCQKLACNAFDLYKEYPTASVFRNAPMHEEDPNNEDYENETIDGKVYLLYCRDQWLAI